MNKTHYHNAKKEGRICEKCEWMVSKKRWEQGYRTCTNCDDAYNGVRVNIGHWPYRDEPREMTGDM